METYLRCFVHACPSKWIHWLPLAEFWYNLTFHSALGRTPFEVLYGYAPRQLGLSAEAIGAYVPQLDDGLSERALMQDLVRHHLNRAQQRMKRQADKHRSERQFEVGNWVFLKLQPYVQSSLARRAHQKLAFKFFGPYQIEAKIGAVAYRLKLPASLAIHPVFHVSQLKASHGAAQVSPALPSDAVEFQVPKQVLQRRWTPGDHAVEQVLIKWSQMPAALATWENYEHLRQRFPRAPAWGMPALKTGGMLLLLIRKHQVMPSLLNKAGPSGSTSPTPW
jgi:hypothetical protein